MSPNDGSMLVTYAALDEAARTIRSQADRLDESLEAIKAKIGSVSPLWSGEAREAYNAAQADWDREAKSIHTSLLQIARAVKEAAPAYQAGDRRAAQGFL
ncbi:WXG100 family type VII secretion target [Streptomyces sp. NPDC021093]|uniref:WXG100 family type VII secretion target n=1 Tax=Streptomyces sp. NPDC021093 TaxID=3365112 RepID=UPI0037A3E2DD